MEQEQRTKSVGQIIRETRGRLGLTQKALAQQVGVHPSFVAKIETSDSFPSYQTCASLSKILGAPLQDIWDRVQKEQERIAQDRIRTRGAAVRTRGAVERTPEWLSSESASDLSTEDILDWFNTDPDLKRALQNLQVALADPQMRPSVLGALEAFAKAARPE